MDLLRRHFYCPRPKFGRRLERERNATERPAADRQGHEEPVAPRKHAVPGEDRADHFAVRNGVRCAGAHLIVDLYGASRLNELNHIEETLRKCVAASGATLLHIHVHHFQPNGVSGVAVLAESHISIHTWPDAGYAALDVFMCGSANPDACVPVLREAFKAKRVAVSELLRGQGL